MSLWPAKFCASPKLSKLLWYFLRLPRQHSIKHRQCTTSFTRNFCLAYLLKCSKGNWRCLYSMILENKSLFMLAGSQTRRKKKILLGQILAPKLLYFLPLGWVLCSDISPPQSTNQSPSGLWDPEVTWKAWITCFFFFFKISLWHKSCFNPHCFFLLQRRILELVFFFLDTTIFCLLLKSR